VVEPPDSIGTITLIRGLSPTPSTLHRLVYTRWCTLLHDVSRILARTAVGRDSGLTLTLLEGGRGGVCTQVGLKHEPVVKGQLEGLGWMRAQLQTLIQEEAEWSMAVQVAGATALLSLCPQDNSQQKDVLEMR
jgi:hypothetical protein